MHPQLIPKPTIYVRELWAENVNKLLYMVVGN